MRLTRSNFGESMTPIHRKHFFDNYDEKSQQWSMVFKQEEMDRKEETEVHDGAFGLWDTNTEGNTINEDSMHEGDTVTYTALRYDKGYELTWELVQDDQTNNFKNIMGGKGKGGSAKALGKGARATIETICATVISGGFANTGYDGVALFSNSHPNIEGGTQDNLLTGALTDTTAKTAHTQLRGQYNESGEVKIPAIGKQLIIHPDNEWNANAIYKSDKPAGELSNDTNTLPRMQIVILDYLPSTFSTRWVLRDPSFENLKLKWRERPWFDGDRIPKTVDYFMFGFMRAAVGYSDWRGMVGSSG